MKNKTMIVQRKSRPQPARQTQKREWMEKNPVFVKEYNKKTRWESLHEIRSLLVSNFVKFRSSKNYENVCVPVLYSDAEEVF